MVLKFIIIVYVFTKITKITVSLDLTYFLPCFDNNFAWINFNINTDIYKAWCIDALAVIKCPSHTFDTGL